MKIFILFCIICSFFTNTSYATDVVIESQLDALDLSSFIHEGEIYTKEIFPDIDVNELLNSALKGEIDNKSLYSGILSILGKEVMNSISLMRKYIDNSCCT